MSGGLGQQLDLGWADPSDLRGNGHYCHDPATQTICRSAENSQSTCSSTSPCCASGVLSLNTGHDLIRVLVRDD